MRRVCPPVAWRLVLPVAAAELALLVAVGNRYGYHRDELYFRVAARHPALGYDDQPVLTPMLGRLSEWAFGGDPRGLRVVSAVGASLAVVLVALIGREVGAGRAGQLIAAASTAASAAVMAVGHLLSTTTFDMLAWLVVIYLVTRILGGGDERQWLLVGVAAGVALENKHLILLLLFSLAAGFVLARRFDPIRSAWLWLGTMIALALWLPNLTWQARHGWPQLELAGSIGSEDPVGNRILLLPFQVLLIGPLLAALWFGGLWWLLRREESRPYRPLGLAYLVLMVLLLAMGGKPYYTIGLLLAILGPGGLVAERAVREGTARGWRLVAVIGASAALAAFVALPIVPVASLHTTPIPTINEDAIETVGWPRFAEAVSRAWRSLPAPEQRSAVVFAGNYGEAGALARFGPSLGLPRAYSGHNAFWRFGRPPDGARPVIVVGYRRPWLRGSFGGCREAGRVDNGAELDNEEQGGVVWICDQPDAPWSQLWPRLRHLDP
jgi:Dolichyl-phosphate-mannose-protein mannosyltransferase